MSYRGTRVAILSLLLTWSSLCRADDPLAALPELPFVIEQRIAHDQTLFTQGMAFDGDTLLESGGGYRQSRLVSRTLLSAAPVASIGLEREWFAEGLTVQNGQLLLLTWQEGIAQQYSLPELKPLQRFRYRGEGWGLTSDGTHLIQSDGSAILRWRDPADFHVVKELHVRAGGKVLKLLNELEWAQGWILANIWLSDWIVGIDPVTGKAAWKIDVGELLSAAERRTADVPNGIAWHAPSGRLWVSGKHWPWLFCLQVALPPIAPAATPQ
ncbi:MAG: glutaminyl-peptide cyclotransferase [Pseudomonadales bacterium]|nr:glutaminyl-peptide cyclotransferase [Gammaproteobacteria bacterium]